MFRHLPLIILAAIALSGCAQFGTARVTDGAAVYRLERPDCTVEVVSARAFDSAGIKVGSDCTLEADAQSTKAAQVLDIIKAVSP